MAPIPRSRRALLTNLIDYAGLYPPAGLPLGAVEEKFAAYLASPESWMMNRVILPAAKLGEARLGEDWRVSLLVEDEPGPLPRQVETLETKLARGLSLPTYCEVPIGQVTGGFAKLRTGRLTADAIPPVEEVADFLCRAAEGRLPFKA